ncbi:metallophosphoesterase [Pseudoflavonifractor capillosus]|uniref:Metallophosphoesterase n=1 Tax=Pseudoflavonifractor capillosus TaxID=106588 RepID=A0A921MJ98_9FIRM|nr:metallophosphoesterase [Pseudoflavonifractor capillosus]HJG85480.1 metallophosphoesterase [Pseudoflavonifractor capillosus]
MAKRKSRPGRRGLRLLLVLALVLLAGGLFFYDQQNRIQTETITAASDRLPAGFDGYRIVQISDLHGKEFGEDNHILLEKTAELEPDLIAITGDVIDDPDQMGILEPLARGLAAIAPTFYVTGNHEWAIREAATVKSLMEEYGVTVLSNEYLKLERGGDTIVLAGIDDPNGPYDQKTPEELSGEIHAALGDPYVLLLAHRNEYYQVYGQCGFDLTLCGHVHGGLIRLPFTDGLVDNTRRRFFPTHTAGLYPLDGGGTLMVSRGLGNGGISFRLFNRPHLPVIVLKAGA